MIERLSTPNVVFRANSPVVNGQDAYKLQMDRNLEIANKENFRVMSQANKTGGASKQIAMQGSGEKLDIMA